MKNKSTILLWTDVGLLLLLLALAATGAVMHWVLPPGGGGRPGGIPGQYSGGAGAGHREVLDLTRHEWSDLHFWTAAVLVALVVFHLVLHWGWIKSCVRRTLDSVFVKPHLQPRPSSSDRS